MLTLSKVAIKRFIIRKEGEQVSLFHEKSSTLANTLGSITMLTSVRRKPNIKSV